ncbi:MAG: hypothetical protein D6800_08610, partial [Candidatus Zixiibacteriota bacterium]
MSARHQLTRNVLYSWSGYLARLLITFFFIPYITSVLGDERYGVWVICFQIISYLSLLDFGIERSLARFIPRYLGRKDYAGVGRVLNTSTVIYLPIGVLVTALAFLLADPIMGRFSIAVPALRLEGIDALKVIGLYLGLRFALTPFGGSLGSFQRYDLSNLLQVGEDIVRTLLMVWALSLDAGLVTLGWIIVFTTLVRLLVGRLLLSNLYPELTFSMRQADKTVARDLFSYGRVAFGITVAWIVIFNSDGILLGLMASTAAAGVFAPATQLLLYLRHIINAVATPLTTAIAQAETEQGPEEVKRLYLRAYLLATILAMFACAGVFVFAKDFVALWLAPDFAEAGAVMRILAVGAVFFIPQIIGNATLFALDKHRTLLGVLIAEAILKIGLAVVLIPRAGLIGMAWATTLPQVLMYSFVYPALVARKVGIRLSET